MGEAVGYVHTLQRLAYQLGTILVGESACNIVGIIEVAFLLGAVVDIYHRLQHRAARHTVIVARSDYICLAFAHLAHQVVKHSASRFQSSLVARKVVPMHQTEHSVFSAPHIPLLQVAVVTVVADVAVGGLCCHHRLGTLADNLI